MSRVSEKPMHGLTGGGWRRSVRHGHRDRTAPTGNHGKTRPRHLPPTHATRESPTLEHGLTAHRTRPAYPATFAPRCPLTRTLAPYSPTSPQALSRLMGSGDTAVFHAGYQPRHARLRRGTPAQQGHPAFPDEWAAVKLVYATLIRAAQRTVACLASPDGGASSNESNSTCRLVICAPYSGCC